VPVRIGERFRDRYQVLEKIGEGAFAYVFRAREETEGRDVAIKVLKEPYRQVRDVVERFQREVFAVASISSPHVVSLLDFGFADDEVFLVLEFVRGPSLRQLVGNAPWSASDVLVVVGQIAHALHAAHQQGIVHRDLKPENVVLVERGGAWQAKVLDFGFAKLADLERRLDLEPITRVGFCFGTPQYLSPEQIRGHNVVDGGADLFALGVIAYEMMAGHRPWDAEDARQVMSAVLKTLPPPVLQLHPTLMPRIEEVNRFLLRVLEKEREQRPTDSPAFFDELQVALFGSPEAAAAALSSSLVSAAPPVPVPPPTLPSRVRPQALAGARPQTILEDVTSRSIVLRATPPLGRSRVDATQVDHAVDETIPFKSHRTPTATTPLSDTVRETVILDSSAIEIMPAVDSAELASQYLPRLDDDENKETLPHGTAQIARSALRPPWDAWLAWARQRWVVVLMVVALLLAAFAAGRYLRF